MSLFSFVKSKVSILDVVLDYVQMKKLGGYWKGPCPFHNETDASFTVSPDKQIFYCFGCHAGGDVIAFIEKAENLTPLEAVNHLVERYNIEVPQHVKKDIAKGGTKKEQFFKTCECVAQWCHEHMRKDKGVLKYLGERHLGEAEQQTFLIGYFGSGPRYINRFIKEMAKQNVLAQDLLDAGILAKGRTNLYSPFEERILFPIKDAIGRYCGFGGRIFRKGDERAKYYNSKESEWFSKGKLLFGLDLAKKEMQRSQSAFLVEGYTDCIAMVKHGYSNTVATLGTACTADHFKVLSRYINVLYVLYDGDAAGQNAILRLTKLCWEANLDLQIVGLPKNQDPASFIESGGDIKKLVDGASDIFTFFVKSIGEQFWGKSLSDKVTLCDRMMQVVARIDDEFKRDILLQKAAEVMQIPFESLKGLLIKNLGSTSTNVVQRDEKQIRPKKIEMSPLEAKIVSMVIHSMGSERVLSVDEDVFPYFSSFARAIFEKVELVTCEQGETAFDVLLQSFDDEHQRAWIIEQSVVETEQSYELFERLMFRFRKQHWRKIVQRMKQKIFEAKQANNVDELKNVLHLFSSLKQEMKQRGLI